MNADGSILAEGERTPGWWARYRFYTAGKPPKGHEDWALRRLSLARWILVYLAIEASCWLVCVAVVVVVTGGATVPVGLWVPAALFALIAPLSAVQYRNKAARSLAPPPLGEVLKQIREPVPPRA